MKHAPKTVSISGKGEAVFNQHPSLLACLEAHNVEVHYHCREGFCGACRVKLEAGEVDYQLDPLAYVDDDEILPCCCTPRGDIQIRLE